MSRIRRGLEEKIGCRVPVDGGACPASRLTAPGLADLLIILRRVGFGFPDTPRGRVADPVEPIEQARLLRRRGVAGLDVLHLMERPDQRTPSHIDMIHVASPWQ